jgi:hypothetical protein
MKRQIQMLDLAREYREIKDEIDGAVQRSGPWTLHLGR